MNISPDYLIERKRNKSQISRWKIIAIILVMLIIALFGKQYLPSYDVKASSKNHQGDYIATIFINEVLDEDTYRTERLNEIADDNHIKAVIVNINSPGGGVVASEMIYDSLRKISEKKPVVTVMGSVAASGGYLIALGGDHLISRNSTITGSIGVILQSAEVTDLAEKLGIKFENFKSSELKASPNPTEKITPEVRKAIMESIDDVYAYFTELVASRRKLDIDYIRSIADGRIYTGRQALKLKLVDEVGNEDNAVKWLYEVKKISPNLKLVEVKLKPKDKLIDMIIEDFDIKIRNFFSVKFEGAKAIVG